MVTGAMVSVNCSAGLDSEPERRCHSLNAFHLSGKPNDLVRFYIMSAYVRDGVAVRSGFRAPGGCQRGLLSGGVV